MSRPLFEAKAVFDTALERWELPTSPVELLSDRDNFVCALRTGAGRRVLRLTHSGRREIEQVEAELRFVEHLEGKGLPVAAPVRSREGKLAERIEAPRGYFSACVLSWAEGQRVTYRSSLWGEALVTSWGQALGRLHALSKGYEPVGARRFAWSDEDVWANALRHLPAHETVARIRRVELQTQLERLGQGPEAFGLIHGDLGSSNFHAEGLRLTLFDFDDCCYHWYAYDVAVALWAYRLLGSDERERHRQTWLQGYRAENELDPLWLGALDLFFEVRALHLLTKSYRDADPERLSERERRARNGWRRLLEEGFFW